LAWIESHQSLGRHPKLLRLSQQLRIHPAQTIGHLQYLWWWALDYSPTGDLSAFASAEISAASYWAGDAEQFLKALKDCGWIDDDNHLHDWEDYAGKLISYRESNARRQSLHRNVDLKKKIRERDEDQCRYCGIIVNWNDKRGSSGGTYDHVIPDGENTLENLVVCCRSCNSSKKDRTPEEAGLVLKKKQNIFETDLNTCLNKFTRQYSTEPNQTKHKLAHISDFDEFWKSYPRKTGKGRAEKTWLKINPNKELSQRILTAVKAQRNSKDWTKDGGIFIPYPATWLNDRRWEDEIYSSNEQKSHFERDRERREAQSAMIRIWRNSGLSPCHGKRIVEEEGKRWCDECLRRLDEHGNEIKESEIEPSEINIGSDSKNKIPVLFLKEIPK